MAEGQVGAISHHGWVLDGVEGECGSDGELTVEVGPREVDNSVEFDGRSEGREQKKHSIEDVEVEDGIEGVPEEGELVGEAVS